MKAFYKIFQEFTYKHEFQRVFDDFLDITICAFGMGRYEDDYLSVINEYDREDINRFALLFQAMIEAYEERFHRDNWGDMLGEIFEEINGPFSRQDHGQFFTPIAVSDLMARLSYKELEGKQLNDPACGSGRCLIAAARYHPGQGFFLGQDIDKRCCKMAAINFLMHNMSGAVIHMDTMTMNPYSGFRIYHPMTGLGIVKLKKEQCQSYLYAEERQESTKTEA